MTSRRNFLSASAAAVGGASLLAPNSANAGTNVQQWESSYSGGPLDTDPLPPATDYKAVTVPDGAALPYKIVDGVKVFHLIAEEIQHEVVKGVTATFWSYNGRLTSTVIEAVEGERVRIYVTNKLAVPTAVHWHGLFLPNGMDGVSGITQKPIPPGETWVYEWTLRQHGTFMYHSHHDAMTQEGMGMTGMFIVHPREPEPDYHVDHDLVFMLNEYAIEAGTSRPDVNEMSDFNLLTMNGKAFPSTTPVLLKTGDKVRMRFGNLSAMDHHPIHLHGYKFKITGTDGGRIPVSAQVMDTTVLVAVGQTRDIEFIADAPGDWLMHCHMTHHVMNQMGHGLPNTLGMDTKGLDASIRRAVPGYMTMGTDGMSSHVEHMLMGHIDTPANSAAMEGMWTQYGFTGMGGMFTIVKVRDELDGVDPDGWYQHPPGTQPEAASANQLQRDGIKNDV